MINSHAIIKRIAILLCTHKTINRQFSPSSWESNPVGFFVFWNYILHMVYAKTGRNPREDINHSHIVYILHRISGKNAGNRLEDINYSDMLYILHRIHTKTGRIRPESAEGYKLFSYAIYPSQDPGKIAGIGWRIYIILILYISFTWFTPKSPDSAGGYKLSWYAIYPSQNPWQKRRNRQEDIYHLNIIYMLIRFPALFCFSPALSYLLPTFPELSPAVTQVWWSYDISVRDPVVYWDHKRKNKAINTKT